MATSLPSIKTALKAKRNDAMITTSNPARYFSHPIIVRPLSGLLTYCVLISLTVDYTNQSLIPRILNRGRILRFASLLSWIGSSHHFS